MNRYGGNTSCVELGLSDGSTLIIDAGTGIRSLGVGIANDLPKINILLTHLHLDHIQGLMFFAPCFRSESQITIWGPSSPEASLEERIESDMEFHRSLCRLTGNETLLHSWNSLEGSIRMSIMFAGREKGVKNMSVDRHRDIVSAIETGDATLVRKTIREHMDEAADNLVA